MRSICILHRTSRTCLLFPSTNNWRRKTGEVFKQLAHEIKMSTGTRRRVLEKTATQSDVLSVS